MKKPRVYNFFSFYYWWGFWRAVLYIATAIFLIFFVIKGFCALPMTLDIELAPEIIADNMCREQTGMGLKEYLGMNEPKYDFDLPKSYEKYLLNQQKQQDRIPCFQERENSLMGFENNNQQTDTIKND